MILLASGRRTEPFTVARARGRSLALAIAVLLLASLSLTPQRASAVTDAEGTDDPDATSDPERGGERLPSRDGDGVEAALRRVEEAAAAHPEDPDLAFALARQLARAGRSEEAVRQTRVLRARWPGHRPEATIEIARVLIEGGGAAAARPLLDEAVAARPDSGVVHFYRGMALRAEHASDEASQELTTAARLEPALASEALLVRALMLFDAGRDSEAVTLLQQLLRVDPTSDTAIRARLLLRDHEIARGSKRLHAEALAGLEWDQNVTLQGAESETRPSDREDFRGLWGAGVSGQPWLGDRMGLLLGYRYDETKQFELDDFDMIQNALFASLSLQPSEALRDRLALRLDVQAYDTLQDQSQALAGGSLRPSVLWSIGPRAGVVRGFAVFEAAQFDEHSRFEPFERDSISGGLGLEHVLPLSLPRAGSSLALSASWLRSVTEADARRSARHFDGDYDYDAFRLRALGRFALPASFSAAVEAAWSHDRYLNDNFTHWLDTFEIEKREDDVASGRVSVSRPIARFTSLEVYWRGSWRSSNVSIFDYDKQIVGLLVRVASDW